MLAPISGSRRDGKSSFRTLTRYLTEGRDPVTDEVIERGEHLLSDNLLSAETAAAEMRAVAFENPRVTDPVYHYQLCWRPGERPKRAHWEEAARKTIKDLGFGEHQFLVVAHDDREHFHVHVLVNRIHPETYKAHYPGFSKRELDKSLREIEHAQGWTPSPGLYRWDAQLRRAVKNTREDMEAYRERGRTDVGRVAQKVEHFQDVESLEAYAKGTPAKELRELLRRGKEDWQSVHQLLKKHGLEMQKAELGGYVVRAIDSELRVKASRVFRDNFSGKENRASIEKQLGPWEPPKRHIQLRDAEQTYQPEAKRDPQQRAERKAERAAERERLKKEYRSYRTAAEKELKAYKDRGRDELRKLTAEQKERREQLRKLSFPHHAKQAARSVLAAESVRERAALKQRLLEEEGKHKPKSYRAWVTERAARGDRAAMSQLRGFVYKERRMAMELGEPGLVLGSIEGVEQDKRTWSDTPELAESLRRHKLLGELRTLQGTVDQRTGHVRYQIAGRQALLDAGQKIWVLDHREATVLAALEMAVQKFGNRLEVTGSEEFKKTVALTAARHGLQVHFQDQNMQRIFDVARELQPRGLERGGPQRGDFGR